MGPLFKYGTHLGIFATTFYFSYSGAEVQKMTLGNLFDNPMPYGQNNNTSGIDNETLNALACLVSKGTKQTAKCKTTENGSTSQWTPYIYKYPHMQMYPEVEEIFNASWHETQKENGGTFDNNKLMPKLVEWCKQKRSKYITVLDRKLLWHMSMFCSNDSRPFQGI